MKAAMNHNQESLTARAAPVLFVVLWSTGFIGTKYVINNADPLTYLAIRMAVVVGLMAIIVAIARPKWPDRIGIAHSAVAGILVHGFYLGGTAIAIAHSIPAGLSALIPGLQPILTSTIANRWLGEKVTPVQWAGLLLGLGGVVMILHNRPMTGEAGIGWLASVVSLISITLGTLYQRRYCNHIDWRAGNLVQYVAVGARLARRGALDRINRTVVLADPPCRGDVGREPVLPGASGHRADGLYAVRGEARCAGDRRHGDVRGRGVCGQPALLEHDPQKCAAVFRKIMLKQLG